MLHGAGTLSLLKMSSNLRKIIAHVRKRLCDRIAEGTSILLGDTIEGSSLERFQAKLIANIESHEKIYSQFYVLKDLDVDEQQVVDREVERAIGLEMDANELLQEVKCELEVRGQREIKIESRADEEKTVREMEKFKLDTEYRRTK